MKKPTVLGIIPARGGSKGIPGKNIKILGGKPLLAYTWDSAQNSTLLTKTILSSDDLEIIQVAKEIGLPVPFVRPDTLATDSSPTLPTIIHALAHFKSLGEEFDYVCLLQTTTPFRRPGMIDEAIAKLIDKKGDALVSVLAVPHEYNPHWVFESDSDDLLRIATGEEKIIPRRQELPPAYFRDGAIYLTKTSVILGENSLFGKNLTFIKGDWDRYVNLDTSQDWKKAEKMISKIYPEI